ncbi:MAG: HEPN domain-containing protein [Bacteroidales bacterium]|nr:HEPN domain-containing protein [Bacteroidales bacterium]
MTLTPQNKSDLVNYRLSRATETLEEAKRLLRDSYTLALVVNRLYYACFYAANALLSSRNIPVKSHKAIVPLLSQYFVKTGVLEHNWFKLYSELLKARNDGDYHDFVEFTEEDVEDYMKEAENFIKILASLITVGS